MPDAIVLVANGDLRLSANQKCWPAQERVEAAVSDAIRRAGRKVQRGHPFDSAKQHGFIDSQKYGMEVFRNLPRTAPLIVVDTAWQYSHHLLHGLYTHQGTILTVDNWSGEWPGLVGMLNLNGSLNKAGVRYNTLWSVDFKDDFFIQGLNRWLNGEPVRHDTSHVHALQDFKLPGDAEAMAREVATKLQCDKAILGIFDEGCMGMYNAIIPDELLHPTGVFKERLSQSALYAEMQRTTDAEAGGVRTWLDENGVRFMTGPDPENDLTDAQILEQCKMYIAALRIADEFGCDAIGIQYQQGLKDLAPASDLAEGLLNNVERPPVFSRDRRELYAGCALPHFNEVDESAGLDALITNRIWTKLGFAPATTLPAVHYGATHDGEFIWVFEISGAAPPRHFIDGYAGVV